MNAKHYEQMFNALQRIKSYQTVDRLKKKSWDDWGVPDPSEAIEMAYENILQEAKIGLKGVRKPVPST